MTRKICIAAAVQKHRCRIRIITVVSGETRRFYVCEVDGDRIRRVLHEGNNYDQLFADITGAGNYQPVEDRKRGKEKPARKAG